MTETINVTGVLSPQEFGALLALADKYKPTTESSSLPISDEKRYIKGVTTCQLCGTVTVQFIQLGKYASGIWKRERDLPPEEVHGIPELLTELIKACWHCEEYLFSRPKEELVKMVLDLKAPIPSKQEIWKRIKELRTGRSSE